MALKSLFSLELLAIVLASISLLVLCRGQLPGECCQCGSLIMNSNNLAGTEISSNKSDGTAE